MNAVSFILTRAAICEHYGGVMGGCCKDGENCPLKNIDCDIRPNMSVTEAENMQALVEKWLDRNKETNSQKFAEIFGEDFITIFSLSNTNAMEWASKKYEK